MTSQLNNLSELLRCAAHRSGATEIAVFSVDRSLFGKKLTSLWHVREDKTGTNRRANAIAAFKKIVRPYINQTSNQAIEIGGNETVDGKMFCLVFIASQENQVIGAGAFIIRCRDRKEASLRLARLQHGLPVY